VALSGSIVGAQGLRLSAENAALRAGMEKLRFDLTNTVRWLASFRRGSEPTGSRMIRSDHAAAGGEIDPLICGPGQVWIMYLALESERPLDIRIRAFDGKAARWPEHECLPLRSAVGGGNCPEFGAVVEKRPGSLLVLNSISRGD